MGNRIVLTLMILWLGAGAASIDHHAAYKTVVSQQTGPRLNQSAPAGELKTREGKLLSIGGVREKPLLVNFWTSWCGPCQAEAPLLQALYEKYGDRIDFYAVNVTSDDKRESVDQFVETYGWTFPVLLDENGRLAELYRVMGYPTSFIIDRDGVLRNQFYYEHPRSLEERIRRIL